MAAQTRRRVQALRRKLSRVDDRPLRVLVALQLGFIVALGIVTAVRVDVSSPIHFADEPAHIDYVRTVAQERRLPILGADKTSRAVAALRAGVDPNSQGAVRQPTGLAGESYEAFQPPLYYVLAAPVFLASDDWRTKVRLVRLFGLVFHLLAAAVLYRLARQVLPEAPLLAFSAALVVLMWPGMVSQAVTVSNAALELLLACAFLYGLWRADAEGSARWLLFAGGLLGLGLLTKLTLVPLVPLLLVVAARHGLRGTDERRWATAAGALAMPLVLLTPWLAFNLRHYDALSANSLAREIQRPAVNPRGIDYTFADFTDLLPNLFGGFFPLEWGFHGPGLPRLADFAFIFPQAALLGFPVLLVLVEPRWLTSRHALLLAAPFVLGVAMVGYVTVGEDWPIMLPRHVYPEYPALALFAAVSWSRLLRSRAPLVLTATSSLILALATLEWLRRYVEAS